MQCTFAVPIAMQKLCASDEVQKMARIVYIQKTWREGLFSLGTPLK